MQFTLQTLMIAFVVVGCAMGMFGLSGLIVVGAIFMISAIIRSSKSLLRTTIWGGWLLFPGLIFVSWFVDRVPVAQESARRCCCLDNLFFIKTGLRMYETTKGCLPSPHFSGDPKKPPHSWRVETLPIFEFNNLFKRYRFNEPWNGPNNIQLAQERPSMYMCPSDPTSSSTLDTNYVAVVGPNTVWSDKEKISVNDIPDGPEKTILLVEMRQSGINWMEPRDLLLEDWNFAKKSAILEQLAPHRERPAWYCKEQQFGHVVFVDGHSIRLSKEVLAEYLPALCSRNGGERVDLDELTAPELDWPRIGSLIGLIVSTLVLIYRPRRGRVGAAVSDESTDFHSAPHPGPLPEGEGDSERADGGRL
jgi:hypothetical protein